MICQICGLPMAPKVINDQFDGEQNWIVCTGPVPHTQTFKGATLSAQMAVRGRAWQMLAAT